MANIYGDTATDDNVPDPGNDANQIQGWYTRWLGRQATPEEIQSHLGNPGGLLAVQTLIANSPEAQAYAAKQAQANQPQSPQALPQDQGVPQTIAPFSGVSYPGFTPPPLPKELQTAFHLPSAQDLRANDPGYDTRLQTGIDTRQMSAAANGSLLNGGTQKALERYGQDYASNEYQNYVNQLLGTRQQQSADYLNLAYGPAWQQNQSAVGQYNNLYGQYQDLIGNNRNAYNDYWQHQLDLLNVGAGAAGAGNPGTGSA